MNKNTKRYSFLCVLLSVLLMFSSISVYANETQVTDASGYVTGWSNFTTYSQYDFTQRNACVPTAVANVLSYFQMARGVSLFSGSTITQSIYDQICTDVKLGPTGSNMLNAASGLETFCKRAGKTCVIDTYLLNLWSDVTRDITANKPILLHTLQGDDAHLCVIFGYRVVNGIKQVYVWSCEGNSDWEWWDFDGLNSPRMRSVNIY